MSKQIKAGAINSSGSTNTSMGLGSSLLTWDVQSLIEGYSAVDSSQPIPIRNEQDATAYLAAYGFNVEDPIERAELMGHFHEAVNFIRDYFLYPKNPEGLKAEIPRKIFEIQGPQDLLVYASSRQPQMAAWACAIMKVMHTICHMDKDLRAPYIHEIQAQIFARFNSYIHKSDSGELFLRDLEDSQMNDEVPLVHFQMKPKKARESVLIKLLHKPENVAEDIFDRVGVRFVAKNKWYALKAIQFLRDHFIVVPANIKPSRSRNQMINTKECLDLIRSWNQDSKSEEDLQMEFEKLSGSKDSTDNPHSSSAYESIQFTCRQFIKLENEVFVRLKELRSFLVLSKNQEPNLLRQLELIDKLKTPKMLKFFYPFEVQVLTEKAYAESLQGEASHEAYKNSQIAAAMRRVFNGLPLQ